jgi:hypothetical protein
MLLIVWLLLLLVTFLGALWGGDKMARFHDAPREVVGTLVVAACVLGPVALVTSSVLPGGTLALLLIAIAVVAGLFTGYVRGE